MKYCERIGKYIKKYSDRHIYKCSYKITYEREHSETVGRSSSHNKVHILEL